VNTCVEGSNPSFSAPGLFWPAPRRGGRAVECGGLENRYPSLGGSRVQIPPPPLYQAETRTVTPDAGLRPRLLGAARSPLKSAENRLTLALTGPQLARGA
jgi:hypothetical protein